MKCVVFKYPQEKIRRVLKAKESEADSKQITFDMGSHQEQILHAQKKYRMYLHALLGAEGITVFFNFHSISWPPFTVLHLS